MSSIPLIKMNENVELFFIFYSIRKKELLKRVWLNANNVMKKNINNKNEYCCNEMKNTLEDPRVYIGYSSKYREYYINTDHSMIIHTIKYCPWCSEKLPESVRMRWFDILEKEYGIDHPRYEEQAELIPEEFKSDEWWKKRGL